MTKDITSDIRVISRHEAKPFIEKHHYTHSIGKVSVAFGLFIGARLAGVITYGQVSGRLTAQSIIEGGDFTTVMEFLRMALHPNVSYPCTQFMAKTIKMMRDIYPALKVLITFADQTEGHLGIVYQAGNWVYTGKTRCKYHYLVDGVRVNKRQAYDRAVKLRTTERKFIEANPNWVKVVELPKHRYIYPLSKKINMKLKIQDYPKELDTK